MEGGGPTAFDMFKGVLSFFVVALGGVAVGVVWGVLTSLLTKVGAMIRWTP
jgi:NhaP-type Na+/H+ or K+/H+ antiporter